MRSPPPQPRAGDNLLDPGQASIESRRIELTFTEEVDLQILRLGNGADPGTMDLLEEAVHNVEAFMEIPLPAQAITVLFANAVGPGHCVTNSGTVITILPEIEADGQFLPGVLAHEVAHFYWRGNRDWLDEGMAEFIEAHHWSRTVGGRL